ncbi:MAG: hypothetical protein RL294_1271 [Actinomycetota bacterium]|jgi:uncharacterized cupin superfamily protein
MNAVPTIHAPDANAMPLPPHAPKPTSIDGQVESSAAMWKSEDGLAETGVWECTAGTFTASRDGYDEVAVILSGKATVVSDAGDTVVVGPGSTLITPAGWIGTWTVHENIRKVYVLRTIR